MYKLFRVIGDVEVLLSKHHDIGAARRTQQVEYDKLNTLERKHVKIKIKKGNRWVV